MKSPYRADLLLLFSAAIWGFAFVAQRMGMESMGPLLFNGIRFGLGSVVVGGFVFLKSRQHALKAKPEGSAAERSDVRLWRVGSRQLLLNGSILGIILFTGATFQQFGLVTTTAGNAGFITGLYVILVPVIGIFTGQRARVLVWIGAVLAVAGLYLLSVQEGFRLSPGDSLVMISAVVWAVHVLLVGRYSPKTDPVKLALVQFAVCALLSLASALVFEQNTAEGVKAAFWPLMYGGFLSVGLGFTLQVVAQKDAPPAHAAIILSLEAVFAVIGGILILSEGLTLRAGIGCLLMLAGMIVAQLRRQKAG